MLRRLMMASAGGAFISEVLKTNPYGFWVVPYGAERLVNLGSGDEDLAPSYTVTVRGNIANNREPTHSELPAALKFNNATTSVLRPYVGQTINSAGIRNIGDYTVIAAMRYLHRAGADWQTIMDIGASGETLATNYQLRVAIRAQGQYVTLFHEYGAGIDAISDDIAFPTPLVNGQSYTIAVTRNNADLKHRVYLDGVFVGEGNFDQPASGGTSTQAFFGTTAVPNNLANFELSALIYYKEELEAATIAKLVPTNNTDTPPVNANVAYGKAVTGNFTPTTGTFDKVTDDVLGTTTTTYVGTVGAGHVVVDLGKEYYIDKVKVWHYHDGRTYFDTKTEVSLDGVVWDTVFDSAVEGTYSDTSSGKVHSFPLRKVRYIRDWANGSSANTGTHWVEIQAYRNPMPEVLALVQPNANQPDGDIVIVDHMGNAWETYGHTRIETIGGRKAIYFDGNGDYLRCDGLASLIAHAMILQNGFTVEAFVTNMDNVAEAGVIFGINTNTGGNVLLVSTQTLFVEPTSYDLPTWLPVGTRVHVAMARQGNTWRYFVDGVLQISVVDNENILTNARVSIGQEFDSNVTSNFLNGYLEELVVTAGAKYTANFTPPATLHPRP